MKKTIFKFLTILCSVVILNYSGSAQSTACQYTTCPPAINFNNSDLLQIYAAVVSGAGSAGGGTWTASGNVGGYTTKLYSPVETSGLYASGDCVGGVISLTDIFRVGQVSGVLQDIEIFDNNAQNANLIIDFWGESNPGTFTDNSPAVLGASGSSHLGTILVSSGDYITTGTRSRATLTGLGLTIRSKTGAALPRNVYATIITTSTPTYGTGTTFLSLKAGVLQD